MELIEGDLEVTGAEVISNSPGAASNRGEPVALLTFGTGPKRLLFIQRGPGSMVPKGMWLRMSRRRPDPYAKAGYAVWGVTRSRHMPAGHTIADMVDDYAQVINQAFGGRADLLVGESYGGLIAQYLAAFHPGSLGHMALVVTGAELPG